MTTKITSAQRASFIARRRERLASAGLPVSDAEELEEIEEKITAIERIMAQAPVSAIDVGLDVELARCMLSEKRVELGHYQRSGGRIHG